jgi:hypothetical protein
VTIGFADAMRVHVSQKDVTGYCGELQILIFAQEGVGVRDSVFADLSRRDP